MMPEERDILCAIASEDYAEATRMVVAYCDTLDVTCLESLAHGIGFLEDVLRTARTVRAHTAHDAEVVAGLRRLAAGLRTSEPELTLIG